MSGVLLALMELRRFRPGLPRLVVGALAAIPVVYGAIYLWAYWDPFSELDNVPVAVVNQDRPVTVRGQEIAGGRELTDQLKQTRDFDYRFTDARDARTGLHDGHYFITITVPADFSRRLASGAGTAPQQAEVRFALDGANGFLISQFVSTARTQIAKQINSAAATAYTQSAVGDLGQLRGQLSQALGALGDVRSSTRDAAAASRELVATLVPLGSATGSLAQSGTELARSVDGLSRLLAQLQSTVAPASDELLGAIADASSDATAAATVTRRAADRVAWRTARIRRLLQSLERSYPVLARSRTFLELLAAATRASDATAAGREAAGRTERTSAQLTARLRRLRQATRSTRASGASQDIVSGLQRSVASAQRALDQLQQATRAAGRAGDHLASALNGVDRGIGRIQRQVRSSLRQVPSLNAKQRSQVADFLGAPVRPVTTEYHPAGAYGRGFAPFFFSIGLWVFGLFCFFALRPLSPWLLASRATSATVAVTGWLAAWLLATGGVALLLLVTEIGLGLDADHLLATIAVLLVTAGTFTALIQLFRAALGVAGDAVGLLLLMIQLGGSAGIYPPQASTGLFRALHDVLPMTYSIDALRVTISGGLTSHALRDVAALLGFLVGAVAFTALVAHRQRTWTMEQLHPSIEL